MLWAPMDCWLSPGVASSFRGEDPKGFVGQNSGGGPGALPSKLHFGIL